MSEEEYTVNVPMTLTFCPVCDECMNREGTAAVLPEPGLRGPTIEAMAHAIQVKMAEMLEADIIHHYQTRHPRRYRWFVRTGWKWVLG